MSSVAYDTTLGPLVGGDAVVTLLLSQLIYWHGRDAKGSLRYGTVRDKEGNYWLAKSSSELEKETLLTRKQVRRGLEVLSNTNLITVKVMRFMGHATNHIRFTCLRGNHEVLTAQKLLEQHVQKGHLVVPKGPTKICQKGQLTTETTTEITENLKPATEVANPAKPEQQQQGQAGENNGNYNPPYSPSLTAGEKMKASEVVSKHKAGKEAELSTRSIPTKPTDVVLRWQKHAAAAGLYSKEPSPMQKGQFKHLFTALGPRTNDVVDLAFSSWYKFTSRVVGAKGEDKSPPSQPHIGFLLLHHDIALQLIAKGDVVQQQMAKLEQKLIDKPKSLCNPVAQPKETKFIPSEQDIQDAFNQLAAVQQKD